MNVLFHATSGLVIGLSLSIQSGCASPQVAQNVRINRAFEEVDRILIHRDDLDEALEIADPQWIQELKGVHARAKWDPIPATMPIGLIAIDGYAGDEHRFKLVVGANWLMDTKDGRIIRWASMKESDGEWIQREIRDRLPELPGVL